MSRILLRIVEGVAVATATGGVLWTLQHPSRARVGLNSFVVRLGSLDSAWTTAAFTSVVVFLALSAALWVRQARRMDSYGESFWEFELRMPSWPVALLGAAALFALLGQGLRLSQTESWGSLVPLFLALWLLARFLLRFRAGWQRFWSPV
jgi:hypothetical protein